MMPNTTKTIEQQLQDANDAIVALQEANRANSRRKKPKGFLKVTKALVVDLPLTVATGATVVVEDIVDVSTEITGSMKEFVADWSNEQRIKNKARRSVIRKNKDKLEEFYTKQFEAELKEMLEE